MSASHPACSSHCCILHGCKYGYEDCPVVTGVEKQEFLCERCSEDGLDSLDDLSPTVKRCPHCHHKL